MHTTMLLAIVDHTLSLPTLHAEMRRLYSQRTSKATQRSYHSGNRCTQFCSQSSLPSIPTSELTLILFITHLATRKLSSTTIKVYMSAIRHAHITAGHHTIFESELTPRVQQLLTGIHKETSVTKSTRPCLIITPDMMGNLLQNAQQPYQSIMLWDACRTTFSGFLRVSEFTVPSQQSYDPLYHLSRSDIKLDNQHALTSVRLCIKQSKTDSLRQGAYIYLAKTD